MWHGPPNIVVVVTEMKEGWVLRINSVPSFFVCCIFHIISIPFNCSDIAIRVAKTVIGAKVITLCFAIFASFLEFRTRTRCLQSVSSAFFHLGNRAEISHTNPGGNWSPSTGLMWRGAKVTHLQIHIRELKQRRRRRQQERQKSNRIRLAKQQLCTCITLFCTFLCRRCTTTTWKCLFSRFVEDGRTQDNNFLFLFLNFDTVL